MSVNVLVIFYSRYGETEKLALAAGVGAIQMRANIRLRRLPDLTDAETISRDAEWSENLARMTKDYIAPRDIDVEWAEVLVLAAPRDRSAEMEQFLGSAGDALKGKLAAVLGLFGPAAERAGLTVVPRGGEIENSDQALNYGRQAAEAGRAKKPANASSHT